MHLGRMIDKCRASLAGTLGDYNFPCPMDQCLLDFARVTTAQFTAAVQGRSDPAVVTWFLSVATPRSPLEIEAWNRRLLTLAPDTPEKKDHFKTLRDAIDPTRTDVDTWADLLDLEEGRLTMSPGPSRQG